MPEIAVRMTKRNHNAFVHLLAALESQGFDLGELLITKDFNEILKAKPKVVLYSFFTEEVWGDLPKEVQLLKERGALLVAGGYHAIAMPRHTLNVLGFDIAVIGEGEEVPAFDNPKEDGLQDNSRACRGEGSRLLPQRRVYLHRLRKG